MAELARALGPAAEIFRGHKATMCGALLASGTAGVVGLLVYLVLAVSGRPSLLPLVPAFVFLSIIGTIRIGPPDVR